MDFLFFLREKRATLLILGGVILSIIWFILMTNFGLFSIFPFGSDLSMGWTLVIFVPLAPILLFATYWGGSENSPIYDTFIYQIAHAIYVAFKNGMIILAILTLIIGFPRMKYYQMRASEFPRAELSFYERRTLWNMFDQGAYLLNNTAEYNEEPSNLGLTPVDTADTESSSSSDNDDMDGLGEALAQLLIFLVVILVVIYFFGLVILSAIYADFWLVAIICIAVGMICLGFIDIHDGPNV